VRRRGTFILVGIILVAGTAAFSVGRTAALRQSNGATRAPVQWLKGASPQTVQAEEGFDQQTRRLVDDIHTKQAVLSSMLPDTRFTGEQVLRQVDDIAQSYASLARSVAEHVAYLHTVLPAAQRQQVMQSCANSVRGSVQRRYRWRRGAQDQAVASGRRGGWGRGEGGRGAGYGRQYRGGRSDGAQGLDARLQLTQEQNSWIQQEDPDFQAQCAALRDQLYKAHTDLVASLEDVQTTKQELTTKVEALIEARDALEKRVAQHIVLLRPRLSQEQRDRLSRLCTYSAGAGSPTLTGPDPLGSVLTGLLFCPVLAGSL
jgi:uncharacterized protein YoxC